MSEHSEGESGIIYEASRTGVALRLRIIDSSSNSLALEAVERVKNFRNILITFKYS
jgi:hypothetical protein